MLHVVRYEDLVADPDGTVSAVDSFLSLEPHAVTHARGHAQNQPHRERWRHEPDRVALTERFEEAVNRFGYSLAEWDA